MAAATSKTNPPRIRKRVEAETSSLKRARDGSAFTRCEACNKDVPVGLIDMHSCSLDSMIKMNLESQLVETVTEITRPAQRKKAMLSDSKAKSGGRKEKKVKDPNKPKRLPTAFFLFMADFRVEYKEANPNSKRVSAVAKEGGERWKSMTDEEKKPYMDKFLELKAEFAKTLENESNDDDAECEEVQVVSDKE